MLCTHRSISCPCLRVFADTHTGNSDSPSISGQVTLGFIKPQPVHVWASGRVWVAQTLAYYPSPTIEHQYKRLLRLPRWLSSIPMRGNDIVPGYPLSKLRP